MEAVDKNYILLYKLLVILLWLSLWGLSEELINYVSRKNTAIKMTIYISIVFIIIALAYNNPEMFNQI
jgi:hypothetical protein